jgi:tetratricopeptide (TPR) repeat protein
MNSIIMQRTLFTFIVLLAILLNSCMPLEEKAQQLMREGTEQVAQGKHTEAIKTFTRAIELIPDFAQAYTFRGSAKFDIGDWDGAYDDYTKAIEIDPTYAEPYDFRGRLRLFWYDEEGACEDFKRAFVLGRPGMFERIRRCD